MSGSFPAASAGSGRGHCVYATGEVRAPASFVLDIIKQRRDKYDPCFNGVQVLKAYFGWTDKSRCL